MAIGGGVVASSASEPKPWTSVKTGAACMILPAEDEIRALVLNSGAKVDAPDCKVAVRSAMAPAAVFNKATTFNVAKACVKGASVIRNQTEVANLETNCDSPDDPYAETIPQPVVGKCDFRRKVYERKIVRLKPGVYCGSHNFNGVKKIKLAPGLYVVRKGSWNVNGSKFVGKNVSIYLHNRSGIQFNSGSLIRLSAPTDGPYKDILFFERKGLKHSRIVFNDVRRQLLRGLIYLPSRTLIYNAGAHLRSHDFALVAKKLILNQVKWRIAPFGPTDIVKR